MNLSLNSSTYNFTTDHHNSAYYYQNLNPSHDSNYCANIPTADDCVAQHYCYHCGEETFFSDIDEPCHYLESIFEALWTCRIKNIHFNHNRGRIMTYYFFYTIFQNYETRATYPLILYLTCWCITGVHAKYLPALKAAVSLCFSICFFSSYYSPKFDSSVGGYAYLFVQVFTGSLVNLILLPCFAPKFFFIGLSILLACSISCSWSLICVGMIGGICYVDATLEGDDVDEWSFSLFLIFGGLIHDCFSFSLPPLALFIFGAIALYSLFKLLRSFYEYLLQEKALTVRDLPNLELNLYIWTVFSTAAQLYLLFHSYTMATFNHTRDTMKSPYAPSQILKVAHGSFLIAWSLHHEILPFRTLEAVQRFPKTSRPTAWTHSHIILYLSLYQLIVMLLTTWNHSSISGWICNTVVGIITHIMAIDTHRREISLTCGSSFLAIVLHLLMIGCLGLTFAGDSYRWTEKFLPYVNAVSAAVKLLIAKLTQSPLRYHRDLSRYDLEQSLELQRDLNGHINKLRAGARNLND